MSTWLLDSLLITSLMLGAILVIRRPVARAFGPGIAYMLWLIPALRLLVPSITSSTPAPAEGSQAVRDAVRDAVMTRITTPAPTINASGELVTSSINWTSLALIAWLGGAAVMFVIQMIRYASMRDELLSEATEIDNIDGISVVASDRVGGPLAFGLFHRYIAVPANFARAYPPAERELAIAHEMAHHKSGDLFANMAAFTFLCLQWFNPLAWMSWSAFRFDQEAACDARVLAGKDKAARQAYGRALARTAFDGVPTFATALNSPKTILERLRRLTMKDASKQRQSLGKAALLIAAAIVLPLSATFVPAAVKAASEEKTEGETKIVKKVKVIKMDKDGNVTSMGDSEPGFVSEINRDGKKYVFHTDHQLDDAELEQMIADAEASRGKAEAIRVQAEAAAAGAEIARGHAEEARANAEKYRIIAMKQVEDMDIPSMIPDIDISEITRNCRDGQPVTTNVEGFDGNKKSRVKIVMCGKGQAKLARIEAIKGLKEARDNLKDENDMPVKVRKEVIEKLDAQIKRMENESDAD